MKNLIKQRLDGRFRRDPDAVRVLDEDTINPLVLELEHVDKVAHVVGHGLQ